MIRLVSTGMALAVTGLLVTPMAQAKDDDRREVEISGSCSKSARWDLKAKERDGRTEIEFEVDSGRRGQRWSYTVTQNGTRVMSGKKRTRGSSGSFSVERYGRPAVGSQTITGRAQNRRSGEICLGTLRL